MRRAPRTDGNQPQIVQDLRKIGASVAIGSAIGKGFPDLVVGYRGKTFLLEVKDPSKPKSDRQLTPDQVKFRDGWNGHYAVVETSEQAIDSLQRAE